MGIIIIKVYKRVISFIKKIILKSLYVNHIKFGKKNILYPGCHLTIEKRGKVIIGNNCFFNHGCSINCLNEIMIGDDCIFGENVKIYDHNHKFKENNELIKKQGYDIGKVIIGNNCWIGSDVIILSNVKIGNGVVIGAGTIVTKDIEDNAIVIDKTNIKKMERII